MKTESNGDKKTTASMTKGANGNSQKGGESSSDGHGGGNKNSVDNINGPPIPPEVDEFVQTGTIKILQSPHISEGPGRIANAPVPSVYVSWALPSFAFVRRECIRELPRGRNLISFFFLCNWEFR